MGRKEKTYHDFPYQIDSSFEIIASGHWSSGGAGRVLHGAAAVDDLDLPPAQFGILAQLMQAARRSNGRPADAFVRSKDLAFGLARLAGLGDADIRNVHRAVNKLRQRLMRSGVTAYAKRGGVRWSNKIIESHRLGYRISLPPENQHLYLLDLT